MANLLNFKLISRYFNFNPLNNIICVQCTVRNHIFCVLHYFSILLLYLPGLNIYGVSAC